MSTEISRENFLRKLEKRNLTGLTKMTKTLWENAVCSDEIKHTFFQNGYFNIKTKLHLTATVKYVCGSNMISGYPFRLQFLSSWMRFLILEI